MNENISRKFVEIFFKMMNEQLICYGRLNDVVLGIVTGIDTDFNELWQHQNFLWRIGKNEGELADLIVLCEFLCANQLVDGDKIIISENALIENLGLIGWPKVKCQKVLDDLISIEMKMIDNGEETDSFFIHF
jgi:hypothetical protein